MEKIYIRDDFIKLGQALKLAGAVGSGVDAKFAVNEGCVKVNGSVCTQRGRKVSENDIISFNDMEFIICKM